MVWLRGGEKGGGLWLENEAIGKLIFARDALSITDNGSACELTTVMAGTAPSKSLTENTV